MKILFFARLFYPHRGGVETHVREIGKRLVEMGHTVTVVTEFSESYNTTYQSNAESAKMMGRIDGIRIVRFDGGKHNFLKKFRIWLWLLRNKRLIADADIVHAHDVFFWYMPFRLLFPKKPVFTTFHGYETIYPPQKKAIFVRKVSETLSFGNICVGRYIEKWYHTNPTYITYGGVENSEFKVQSSKQKNTIKHILFMGRLEEDIGIRLYLQAIREIKKRKNIEVTFLGEGSFRKEAEAQGHVTTAAYQDKKLFEKLLNDSDMVFASSYLSMLSAMIAKKPLVAVYTNPLKKDYLVMTPFAEYISLVDSVDGIGEAMENVHPEKIEQAYQWAKEQTWEKVVEMYLRLWNYEN